MILRNVKSCTEINTDNNSLLDFLGVKKELQGLQKVSQNVELIASVPFCLSKDGESDRGYSWTLSTFDLDRYDERIDPQGWDFKRYMENPVVEWSHRYDIPAIGKIESLTIDDKGLHGVVFFNSKDFDPFGWSIGERVKAGVIHAGSVGFRVLEIEIPDKKTQEDGTYLIFRKQELLEFSICNVPANPWALAKPNALAKNIEAVNSETSEQLNHLSYWGGLINKL
ncbi:MAG: HK97 family phage prohead protease [Treponema sp.]|nr:HK97 family phage prohead protease [Treponema sp.]